MKSLIHLTALPMNSGLICSLEPKIFIMSKQKILYGAGTMGRQAFEYYGADNIYAFADMNKAGGVYLGKPVLHPFDLAVLCRDYDIIICIARCDEVIDYFKSIPVDTYRLFTGSGDVRIRVGKYNLNANDLRLIAQIDNSIKEQKELIKTYKYIGKYLTGRSKATDGIAINPSVSVNQTIWQCWLQGFDQAPMLVKKCMGSVEKNKPVSWNRILITLDNLHEYIDLPEFVLEKYKHGVISNTHFSDIIRLELLNRYGGCWIDATVFCSAQIPLDMISSELFLFRWSVMDVSIIKMSNWWIASQKDNAILGQVIECLYQYWKRENALKNYFLFHIVFSRIIETNKNNKDMFYRMKYMNNSAPHILQEQLANEYDKDRWKQLKTVSDVHKLTYKNDFHKKGVYTFYDAFLDGKLDGEYLSEDEPTKRKVYELFADDSPSVGW